MNKKQAKIKIHFRQEIKNKYIKKSIIVKVTV